jgi:tRNA pseudouridine55 synthase
MDGLLLLDKPAGPTSHDAVDAVRRTFRIRRAGHAGTLDPAATGLLLVLTGRLTRAAEYLEGLDKAYRVTVRLGVRTDTDDLAGAVIGERPVPPLSADALESALARFRGTFEQRPPDYAALKVGGRRMHALARAGTPADVPPRPVTVHTLSLAAWRPPELELDVVCAAGTYVRAIARDLGETLGCGGTVASLRRLRVGAFRVEDAVALQGLGRRPPADLLLAPDRALAHLPRVALRPEAAEKVRHGKVIDPEDFAAPPPAGLTDDAPCRLCAGEVLLAVGHVAHASAGAAGGPLIRPRKVFL